MRWGGGVREPGLRGQQHSWLESWLGALETKQAGSISGGEGVMSFFCRKSKDEHGGEGGRWQPLGDAIPTLGHFGEEFQGKYV